MVTELLSHIIYLPTYSLKQYQSRQSGSRHKHQEFTPQGNKECQRQSQFNQNKRGPSQLYQDTNAERNKTRKRLKVNNVRSVCKNKIYTANVDYTHLESSFILSPQSLDGLEIISKIFSENTLEVKM